MGREPDAGRAAAVIRSLRSLVTHPYLAFLLRVYLGGVFIYASLYKINFPAEFAESIAVYQVLPHHVINITAVVLPWLELTCGILLVLGIRAKSATLIIIFLLVVFGAAIFINLLRESPISCGCFTTLDEEMSWKTFLRDLLWLGIGLHVFVYDRAFHLERQFTRLLKEVEP